MANRLVTEAATAVPDTLRLVSGLVSDPRVPPMAKAEAAALVAIGLGPWDALPVVGQLSAVTMTSLALGRLIRLAGPDLVREHWRGSEAGLAVLLALAGPGGIGPRRFALRLLPSVIRGRAVN